VINVIGDLLKRLFGKDAIDYDEAKTLAKHKDIKVRQEVAARQDVKPEILYFLAEDPSPKVRRIVAANTAAPSHASVLLAKDSDHTVRGSLAKKIADLAPGLSADEQNKVHRMTYEALEILARDQVVRVRQVLSEALKDVAGAPPGVIKGLALDVEFIVSGPVLEFSPVLSDKDLLEIIASTPVKGALAAISRRSSVDETVSEAIVETNDVDAVADLLANSSAQIREETLDSIIDKAVDVTQWQGPLVGRPTLSSAAASKLASFVADNLLDILMQRKDLDEKTGEKVRQVVRQRLEEDSDKKAQRKKSNDKDKKPETKDEKKETPMDMAQRLSREGRLDEKAISESMKAGGNKFVISALSVLSGVPFRTVQKAIATQSVKGIVAICWKSELSMTMAKQLQVKLARIPPSKSIKPNAGGGYPLGEEEMAWQLEFLERL
jgi:uncharacterized protein (DUF2336 family)